MSELLQALPHIENLILTTPFSKSDSLYTFPNGYLTVGSLFGNFISVINP